MKKEHFWSPYVAGAGLGLTLLATFYIAGWGLGASSAFSILTGVGIHSVSPDFAEGLDYFAKYFRTDAPLMKWIIFLVIGVFIGSLASSIGFKNFKIKFDKNTLMDNKTRLLFALSGGLLMGFASRLARGCTSGIVLTGGAQLALSSWIFVLSFFIMGFVGSRIAGRVWE